MAQSTNFSGCSGTGCVTARNGGTTPKMGFLPDGTVWFDSNRDVWRDNANAFQGKEAPLVWSPSSPAAFDALPSLSGAKILAVSRDGTLSASVKDQAIVIHDASGVEVRVSAADFNVANSPGFMRFVD